MKEYTVYELEAGDKLYHVTDDNKIEEITLTENQLNIKFDRGFCCFYSKGKSYEDKSYAVIIKDEAFYYIKQQNLQDKNERVYVYSLDFDFEGLFDYISLNKAEDIKVYATKEAAEKEVAKRNLAEFKKEFFAKIRKAEIYDAISNRKLITVNAKSAEAFTKFKKTIKKFEEDGPVTVKIETRDGLTFTVDEFENYLQTQIEKLTDK